MLLLVLYFLTFVDEFRYITVKPMVKVTEPGLNGRRISQRAPDFSRSAIPRPPYHFSMHSTVPGVGTPGSASAGRYVYDSRGGLIWVPSKLLGL